MDEITNAQEIKESRTITFDPVEIDGVVITVEVIDADFDEEVALSVTVEEENEEIEQALNQELEQQGYTLASYKIYDIKLLNDDGEEVEPKEGSLKVSISDQSELVLLTEEEEVQEGVFHVKDSNELVDMNAEKNDETGELEFKTSHFSKFVAYKTGSSKMIDGDGNYINTHETKWEVSQPNFGIQSDAITQKVDILEVDGKGKPRYVKDTFIIDENAEGDLYTFVELGDALSRAIVMPGDNMKTDFSLINKSNHIYRYKAGSWEVAPSADGQGVDDTIAFNGLPVPEISRGYRIVNTAIKALFPGMKEAAIVNNKLSDEELYGALKALGYEGEGALTRYFLDYYKGDSGAEKLDDLDINKIIRIFPNIITYNPDLVETESEIIELYFNFWNNVLFKVSYDGAKPVNSIGASMRNDDGQREQSDAIFSGMGTIDKYNGTEVEYVGSAPLWFELDGPKTTNIYTQTSFSYTMGFALEQIDHNLTINYINLDNGNPMGDAYQETIYIEEPYDVTAAANKTFEGYNLVRMDGDALTGTGDTDKVINVYYSAPKTPELPGKHTITIHYFLKGTNTQISSPYSVTLEENSDYNVTELTKLVISGYTWDSCDNGVTEGKLSSDLVFNVYYTKNTTTPDPDPTPSTRPSGGGGGGSSSGTKPGRSTSTPEGGPGVTTTIENQEVPMAPAPTTTIPETEVPLAPLPKTGDTSGTKNGMLLLASGLVMAMYLMFRRKEEQE